MVRAELRKNLRTDWLISGGFGNGSKTVVVISAPNCGFCELQNKDLKRVAKKLDLNVLIIPQLLGNGSDEFVSSVMCSPSPAETWSASVNRQRMPQRQAECRNAEWVGIVAGHVYESAGPGRLRVRTPATLKSDGTVQFGWPQGLSDTDISRRLGL